jgi:hypothetical protein
MRFLGQSMSPQGSFLERSAGEVLVRQIFSVTCAESGIGKSNSGLGSRATPGAARSWDLLGWRDEPV